MWKNQYDSHTGVAIVGTTLGRFNVKDLKNGDPEIVPQTKAVMLLTKSSSLPARSSQIERVIGL